MRRVGKISWVSSSTPICSLGFEFPLYKLFWHQVDTCSWLLSNCLTCLVLLLLFSLSLYSFPLTNFIHNPLTPFPWPSFLSRPVRLNSPFASSHLRFSPSREIIVIWLVASRVSLVVVRGDIGCRCWSDVVKIWWTFCMT